MKARILILEDDAEIAELVRIYLEREGMEARQAASAEEAMAAFRGGGWDLVTVDLNLPGKDGFEFLEELRRESLVPVLVVSSREADEDKLRALSVGADDFVAKPFNPALLAARVRAQVRRSAYDRELFGAARGGPGPGSTGPDAVGPGAPGRVARGPFVLDLDARSLIKDGRRLALTPKELELFAFLFRNAGKVFGTRELYASVWGQEYGEEITVSIHIQRIRRKIEDDPSAPRWIATVRGFGYRFDPSGGEG